MRLIQYRADDGHPAVAVVDHDGQHARPLLIDRSVYDLAWSALQRQQSLESAVQSQLGEPVLDYPQLLAEGRVLSPLAHPQPARCLVSGTGLTHLGSAAARDAMHQKLVASGEPASLSDSMRMFRSGLEGGRPEAHSVGAQPEWFYKGQGDIVVAPGAPLPSPAFALDGGEEPELVGLYLIDPQGCPRRLGFALGNEFSDHVTERENYLLLAHSKLRPCAIGPELYTGELAADLRGHSRIWRDGALLWEKPFLTGETNMSHSLANLEYHHFKYASHRRPGDVHLHFFGTATLSFADGVQTRTGDIFEVDLPALGAPLRNALGQAAEAWAPGAVRPV